MSDINKRLYIETVGCQMNVLDSEIRKFRAQIPAETQTPLDDDGNRDDGSTGYLVIIQIEVRGVRELDRRHDRLRRDNAECAGSDASCDDRDGVRALRTQFVDEVTRAAGE